MIRKIAIFGEPLTGKSTIAEELNKKIKDLKVVEASANLIYLIANNFKKLPSKENVLISKLKDAFNKKSSKRKISREKAREIFSFLRNKYSVNFIGKALDEIYSKEEKILLSGLRGYKNASYLKNKDYLIIYLKANKKALVNRFIKKRKYTRKTALEELQKENKLYHTKKIEKIADIVFDSSRLSKNKIVKEIKRKIEEVKECKRCINTDENSFIEFNKKGYCKACETYLKNFDKNSLKKELKLFKSFIGTGKGKYDMMVGLSGGKDSSATLYRVKKMGFTPLAFTFDLGYFHPYIYRRAKNISKKLEVDYEIIPVKRYLTKKMLKRFKRLSEIYKRNKKEEFIVDYVNGRTGYKGVIRPCWVCRELIIHARYFEALKHGVKVIAVGINEWTSLNKTTSKKGFNVSAIRKLKPFKNKPAVYIVHFPFLTQTKLRDTKKILKEMGWNYYKNIQSNAASCLLAHSAEKQLFDNLGFHPDTTRLAREVTVGFMTKEEAKKALKKITKSKYTIPEVLKKAKLI